MLQTRKPSLQVRKFKIHQLNTLTILFLKDTFELEILLFSFTFPFDFSRYSKCILLPKSSHLG